MSNVPISPEQRQAEAAQPIEERDLDQAIALHRALAHAEVWIPRLHVGTGNSGKSTSGGNNVDALDAGEPVGPAWGRVGWTGVEFNPHFARFLDESFGVAFPWSAGLKALRHECRRSHSEHWSAPEWRGSLCYQLISMTCRFDWSYERACYDLNVTPERTERTLQRALRRIEDKLAELQARATETVHADAGRNDWMSPVQHQRHDQPGLHASECPQCLRDAAA